MKLRRERPEMTVYVSVSERVYDPATRQNRQLPGRSRSVTLYDTTLEEMWAIIEAALLTAADKTAG